VAVRGVLTHVTEDELWHPSSDPNAETQLVPSAGPGAPILPRQAGPWEAAELAETRVAPGQPGAGFTELGEYGRGTGPGERARQEPDTGRVHPQGGMRRRRLLFAAGGVMLLTGGGVAAAMQTRGAGAGSALASPSGAGTSPRTPRPTRSAAPSTHGAPPGHPSASHPSSATGSAGGSPSGSPSGSASGSPTGSASNLHVPSAPQWYVDDQGPMAIALTMDDGPHPVYTPQVLEIFRQYGVKATFNMIGRQVGPNLSLVREVSAEGHTITNHTWNHADLSKLSVAQVLSQMDRCNDALADANQHPTVFRAPYGNWSHNVFEACAARQLKPVGWSVDPRDWDTEHVTTHEIVANVMEHTHAHDIILEHDGGGDRSNTVAALKIFIPELLDKGFKFVAM
jgi:peptidoglycan/xylan/chitin deacetylase (PgdA/CDA1 family)